MDGIGLDEKQWEYVFDTHGRAEVEAVYGILKKYGDNRFDDRGQKKIAAEVAVALTPMGID